MNWTSETDPLEVITWALEAHSDLIMPSAFNLNGIVLIDLAARAGFSGEVVFVDTGYHFSQTLETRERLALRYPQLKFTTLNANLALDGLYETDTDACCALRKVAPLQEYLREKNPSALLNARSRFQASTRSEIEFLEFANGPVNDSGTSRLRINPLAHWNRERLEGYANTHDLPVNPLYFDGFLSIGCAPCTRAVRPGEDARAGRWAGQAKTECGLWVGQQSI
jgi:phosphoadenosine phosphosulfate reductase